ncbi:MAG: serine protein kinase RIO [Nanoarchaeota archaeon]
MVTLTYQERFRTENGVFDNTTERNLFELQSRRYFDQLIGPYEVGKESNVFLAEKNSKKIIVKIYRVQNCDFKRMFNYIRKDPRYDFLKNKRREIIYAWTQREYKNLYRAQEAQINSPRPIVWRANIILEEMIGTDQPAPRLKDQPPRNPAKFFQEVLKNIEKLYRSGMIHGDLSAFNILNFKEKPYFIDFSQATLVKTPNSLELLERDLRNVVHFFKGLGIKADSEEIFKKLTQDKE